MQTLPNTGTFNDDHFDELRAKALMALVDGRSIPGEVITYLQVLEARMLEQTFKDKKAFARLSWEQFRTVPPTPMDDKE